MTGSREPLSASPSLFPRQTVLSIGKLKYSIGELSEFYFNIKVGEFYLTGKLCLFFLQG